MDECYRNLGTGEVCKILGTERVVSHPKPVEVILIEWADGKTDRWSSDLFYQHFTPVETQAGQTGKASKE